MSRIRTRLARLVKALPSRCARCGQPYAEDPEPAGAGTPLTPEEEAEVVELLCVSCVTCPVCGRLTPTAETFEVIEAWGFARELMKRAARDQSHPDAR